MTLFKTGPKLSDEHVEEDMFEMMASQPHHKDWHDLITKPMEDNCLAPSDEALGLAYDLYCETLDAPFHDSEAEMADHYAEIMGGIADLQIIAPELLDEILSFDDEEDQ